MRVLFGFMPVLVYALWSAVSSRGVTCDTCITSSSCACWPPALLLRLRGGNLPAPLGIASALRGAIPLFTFVSALVFLRSERVTPLSLLGVLVGLAARLTPGHHAALTTYQIGLALLTLALVTNLHGLIALAADRRALIGVVLGLGLLGTGVAYILYYFIVTKLGAVTASSATYIPPVVAIAIGWLLVDEPCNSSTASPCCSS